jgi:hypothetical protein
MKLHSIVAAVFLTLNLVSVHAQETNAAPVVLTAPVSSSTAVQVDISKLLNARVVTTLTGGQVVPLQTSIDGAGGVATQAAATSLNGNAETAVPDDGTFPANADHPEVVLHFSNADGTGFQVHRMPHEEEFSFDVPPKNYAKMLLCFTSGAAGPAKLTVTLTYQDGSTEERDIVCPDWWNNLDEKTNPNKDVVYVAFDLAKWGTKNKTLEKDHHNIFGIDVRPTPGKVLTSIKVHKTRPLVCFWGATGVPTN